MEAELAALAVSGATTFVGLIASEAFERVKGGLARFLRRGGGAGEGADGRAGVGAGVGAGEDVGEDVDAELEADRAELARARAAGDGRAEAVVRDRWRQRLEAVFRADPGAAEELARLLSEVAPEASRGFVTLVTGGVNHGPAFQGARIEGGVTFHVHRNTPPPVPMGGAWDAARGGAPGGAMGGAPDAVVRPDQVPVVTVPFSNRTAELAALDAALGGARDAGGGTGAVPGAVALGVLAGLPGVGKSAMAWRWAARSKELFPGGQLYVDFATLRDHGTLGFPGGPGAPGLPGADVSEALAMCLRALPGGRREIPASLAERTNLFRTRSAELRLLLVLDNVNQPAEVRALIPKGPGSAVLVTSRRGLGELAVNDGARLIPVRPLDAHGGLELLRDRVGVPAVEAERRAAERLVEVCGGLPVALQVAVARLLTDPELTMTALAAELDDEAGRLAGLTLPGEESPVSAVLGPSYRLLSPAAARLYRLLGRLPTGVFDTGVAARAADVPPDAARRLLGELLTASLVERAGDGGDGPGRGRSPGRHAGRPQGRPQDRPEGRSRGAFGGPFGDRFRMHDLVRLDARERADAEAGAAAGAGAGAGAGAAAAEHAALIERVTRHYLVLTARADRAIRADRLRVADLRDLLRDAEDGADSSAAAPSATDPSATDPSATDPFAADPFAAADGPDPLEWLDAERPAILAVLREAAAHGLHTLVWPLAEAFTVLFLYRRYLGAWQESLELGAASASAAAASARTAEEVALVTAGEARLRSLLSRPLLDQEEPGRAGAELERAAALAEASGDLFVRASVLEFLGRYQELHGDPGQAVATLRRCLDLNERAGESRGAALAAFFLGCALDARGDRDRTEAMALLLRARRALENRTEPDRRMAARVTAAIGTVHGHLGETEEAIRELRTAAAVLGEDEGAAHYAAQARERLADVAEGAGGRDALVRESLERALALYEAGGNARAETVRSRLAGLGR
ncbi:hypothetical protein AB0O07_26965 [Streptomyces sp. NPDC093085]|uniref:hypothetical protein n=1 Tax=Streptomyces sp. NPDC093085 TaxID=3155068 RepID=UPI003422BBD1